MSKSDYGIDVELLMEFIDESEEALSQLPAKFVELEKEPENVEIIQSIFRPVHSLKGNAAYFGLLKMKVLAHDLETILDKIRNRQLIINNEVINTLLAGFDELQAILKRAKKQEEEIEDQAKFNALLDRIHSIDGSTNVVNLDLLKCANQEIDSFKMIVQQSMPDAVERIKRIKNLLEQAIGNVQISSGKPAVSGDIPKPIVEIEEVLRENGKRLSDDKVRSILDNLQKLKDTITCPDASVIIAKAIDDYKTIVSTIGFDELLRELILDSVDKIKKIISSAKSSSDNNASLNEIMNKTGSTEKSVKKESEKKTMRISEESMDVFLGYVGELIVVREMFEYLQKRLVSENINETIVEEFRRANDSFIELSHDLQTGIMAIRRLPMRTILQKIPRIIRDIANFSKKEVDVRIAGEEIEVDKSLIEALEAPIMHMVRNAADHGVELPDKRISHGKNRCGMITVEAIERPDNIEISVSDDGSGLNLEGIRKKGEQMGFVKPDQHMSQDEIMRLLFLSGVSTAEKVTDISGRGVGMDVALQNVQKLGGKITINNKPGQGVEFKIIVPKNIGTQILNGYIVRIKNDNFILPLDNIVESFNAAKEDFTNVAGYGTCVSRRGMLMPFKNLYKVFDERESLCDNNKTVVAIRHKDEMYGFGVDEILGIQQIVLKPVKGLIQEQKLFSGAAITGSGGIAMILDVEKVLS